MNTDELIRLWIYASGDTSTIVSNEILLRFLGEWSFSEYQPYPEKAGFWERLGPWLENLTLTDEQQSLFNSLTRLLFAGEADLISMYRAAYEGPVRRWLIDQENLDLTSDDFDQLFKQAKHMTWFGSLAGMDINTFCRVNRIYGQSFRPEFRFVSKFCKTFELSTWLKANSYERIVVVEDMVGTGEQFNQALPSLRDLNDFEILIVPLFIAPDGWSFVQSLLSTPEHSHIACEPVMVLPESTIIRNVPMPDEEPVISELRSIIQRHDNSLFGHGDEYGTLALTYLNCPDNVPSLYHSSFDHPIFPRASREIAE